MVGQDGQLIAQGNVVEVESAESYTDFVNSVAVCVMAKGSCLIAIEQEVVMVVLPGLNEVDLLELHRVWADWYEVRHAGEIQTRLHEMKQHLLATEKEIADLEAKIHGQPA